MAVSETEPKFKTSDGREFTNKKDAERHEALVEASRAYENARRFFGKALAETQRTADDKPFDFSMLTDYWFVWEGWGDPRLAKVDFYIWNCSFDLEREQFEIHQVDPHTKAMRGYRVSELYRYRENAERALVAAQERWIADKIEALAALKVKLGL